MTILRCAKPGGALGTVHLAAELGGTCRPSARRSAKLASHTRGRLGVAHELPPGKRLDPLDAQPVGLEQERDRALAVGHGRTRAGAP